MQTMENRLSTRSTQAPATPKAGNGITIFIPNWNHRNYLPRSVGSALRAAALLQRQNIGCEVLVIDDASRDGSQRVLSNMVMHDATGALHAILSQTNRGLAGTRNLGLKSARYRWVLCMDADNELCPENLVQFYIAAEKTDAVLLYGNLLCKTNGRPNGLLSNDVVHEGILQQNYIDAMAIVDAAKVLDLGGYTSHPHARAHEDWELLLHLIAENAAIVFVPMLLGFYHILDLSMIKQTDFDHSRIHRMFDQRKVGLPAGFRSRVFHPQLGFMI